MPTSTIKTTPANGIETFEVRKASMTDISDLLVLINSHAARGVMLPRTEFEMAENVRDFSVIQHQGQLLGCGALHFYTPHAAEVRSLAIAPEFQGAGAGRALVVALMKEAQAFQVKDVFAFTYVPEFFRKLGFLEIERGDLPLKAWKDCLRCPKFQCCDEIAVVKHLEMDHKGVIDTPASVELQRAINTPVSELPFPLLNKVR
jgi:amino-acid N-acetyltransferase